MEHDLSILLVEDDPATCQSFKEYIAVTSGVTLAAMTNSSFQAVDLVKEYFPDAIILDLELNAGKGNGLQFLQKLQEVALPFRPYILITTNNTSSTTYHFARQLGADFIMFKHQEDYSEKSAVDFLCMTKDLILQSHQSSDVSQRDASSTAATKHIQKMISHELDLIGISPKAIGYQYLMDAISLTIKEKSPNICRALAEKYKKNDSSIERAMQNAINKAWRTSDIDDLLTNYTAHINTEKGVPTLTEFIYYYANKVKNNF